MSLQHLFLGNVSLLGVALACWILCILDELCVLFLWQLDGERSLDRQACGRNPLDCMSLNLGWEERLG